MRFKAYSLHNTGYADDLYYDLWLSLCEGERYEKVFFDGCVTDWQQLKTLLQSNISVGVWDEIAERLVFLAYAKPLNTQYLQAHFCGLGRYHPEQPKAVMNAWREMGFERAMGIIPEPFKTAQKMVKKLGWKMVGALPRYCTLAYESKIVSGNVYHGRL